MKRMRSFDRQNGFLELSKIFEEQASNYNEPKLSIQMRHFAKKHNIPERKIYDYQKKVLRPLFSFNILRKIRR